MANCKKFSKRWKRFLSINLRKQSSWRAARQQQWQREKERERKAQERERRREREKEERKASGGSERVNNALLQLANKSIVSPTRCQQYSSFSPATPFTPSSYFLQWFTNCWATWAIACVRTHTHTHKHTQLECVKRLPLQGRLPAFSSSPSPPPSGSAYSSRWRFTVFP